MRLGRQEGLTGDDPHEYWTILNEAVIRRAVGGGEVMRNQVHQIAEFADRTNITVQVLPFSAGVHPAMDGGFSILGFPDANDPDVVYQENQMGGLYLERVEEIERYTLMFSHLMAKALDPGDSRALITRVAADLA